ncbi:solute carrier family 12 member 9 isoform X2 [Hyposmocoma kahamanoa]|uniref:solute carrier family 12 member 9 isoform X2 n=1 Tax=Hyposmocoma kahamanoa TaxID=1477025 RepID=UPI000E6D93BA|nr:solute carrier family 12 member 9 isoform X2 [Hyposmocoma kahamanoa]
MAETMDPLAPSVNSSSRPSGLMNKLRLRFGRLPAGRAPGEGYVEFGEFRAERTAIKKVGTFAGVFCPVVLSMFSALIFIRMGYLVGNAGLLVTLAQFGMAYLIVLFTVMSICAISTNGAVEGGGVYFMISRTLGPEFGGAIGTLFFFANVASSALCISACTEALVENFGSNGYLVPNSQGIPDGWWYRFLYRSILNAAGLAVSLAGASLFARTSLAIWVTMLVCLSSAFVSFFVAPSQEIPKPDTNQLTNQTFFNYTGLSSKTFYENLYQDYGRDYTTNTGQMVDFASVFGVLFTGVTGVMAGANMSGELKNPGRSIPVGTLTALLFTALSYVALSFLTASTCSRDLLRNNYVYLLPINVWPPFIAVGMLMATFSAGLSNLIGASRVLEALAKDNIFGILLRPMVTRSGNPVLAVIASWLLVQIGIMAGSLNAIAQVNSVLFMTSYFAINLACLGLDLASAPNFRPSFKHFNWMTSLLGLLGCFALMFALRPAYASGAALACCSLVVALHLLSPAAAEPKWGSLSQALIFHQVRKYLLLLDPRREHVKFWRPQMLLLIASPRQAAPLIDFVNDQKKGGLFVIGHVRVGQLDGSGDPLAAEHKYWLKLIDHLKVKAFVELCLAESVRSGAAHLTRLSGLGAMKPDTVLLGFRDTAPPRDFFRDSVSPYKTDSFDLESGDVLFPTRRANDARISALEYVRIISDVLCVNKNVCLCRHFHNLDMAAVERRSAALKYIDVWLVELARPSREEAFTVRGLFALQLAAVVRSARGWQHLRLRVHAVHAAPAAPAAPAEPPSPTSLHAGRTVSVGMDSDVDPRIEDLAAGKPVQERLEELLKLLRINATTHSVTEWPVLEESRWPSDSDDATSIYQRMPLSYVQTVNNIIKRRCQEGTAVTFVQLPPPPKLSPTMTSDDQAISEQYLKVLDEFTKDLSPTILVRGLKSVTSTAL